jgi:hypothetical protein
MEGSPHCGPELQDYGTAFDGFMKKMTAARK